MKNDRCCILKGARVIDPVSGIDEVRDVCWKNGILAEPESISEQDADVLNLQGYVVCPGFIDMHVHGGGGRDFQEGTPEAFKTAVEAHAKHGTHAFGVDEVCSDDGQIAVRHFQNLVISQNDATVLEPSLRCQNLTIYDLC